jgi:hypothetical protein
MVYLAAISLIVSMTGLTILLFASFSKKEDEQVLNGFINKESRKIRVRQEGEAEDKSKADKPGPKFILLLQTIIIGEIVGLFFLTLTKDPSKFNVLFINSIILFGASFFCSILTLFNVWLQKKTNINFRIILQAATLVLGIILMRFAFKEITISPEEYFFKVIYNCYFITVVIAISTMLLNVIFGKTTKTPEFNFSNYLIIVIVSGLIIGTGLLFMSSSF